MKNERGFSATELMIIAGILAGAFLGFTRMIKNQSNAVKAMYLKIEVQNIHNSISEILRNESNCVATVKSISDIPPSFTDSYFVPAIVQYQGMNKSFESIPVYEVGKTYDGVKIASMDLNPYGAKGGKASAYKLEIKYQVSEKVVGTNSITKKVDVFFSKKPSSYFPNYALSCSTAGGVMARPQIEPVEATVFLPGMANPGATIRSAYLECAEGKKAVSCGFNDTMENGAEDSLSCHIDLAYNRCVATIDSDSENADAVTFQCICI